MKEQKKPILEFFRMLLDGNVADVWSDVPESVRASLPPHDIIAKIEEPVLTLAVQGCVKHDHIMDSLDRIGSGPVRGKDLPKAVDTLFGAISETQACNSLSSFVWAGIYQHVPETRRLGGKLMICEGWNVAVTKGRRIVFSQDIFDDSHIGHTFFTVMSRIIRGEHLFDGCPFQLPEDCEYVRVGEFDNGGARQVCLLLQKIRSVTHKLDPWPTEIDEHVHFMGRPFEEYALFYERRRRLNQYDEMLNNVVGLLITESVEKHAIPRDLSNRPVDAIVGPDWGIYLER